MASRAELLAEFTEKFHNGSQKLTADIEAAKAEDRLQDENFVKEVQGRLKEVRAALATFRPLIPKYEVCKAQRSLNDLEAFIRENMLASQKEFKFDEYAESAAFRQPDEERLSRVDGSEDSDPQLTIEALISNYVNTNYRATFNGLENQEIIIDDLGSDRIVRLTDLKRCTVRLSCVVSSAYMADLSDCIVMFSPIRSSAYVNKCERCTFVVACQQLRIHTTKHSDFYVHVNTVPIIEDCIGLAFAPYELNLSEKAEKFRSAGLDVHKNNWNMVKDFNWAYGEQSPNWKVIEEDERQIFRLY